MFGLFGASRQLRLLDRFLRAHCADLDLASSRDTPAQRAMIVISKLRVRNDALQRQYNGAKDLRGPFRVPDVVRTTQPPGAVLGEKSHKN